MSEELEASEPESARDTMQRAYEESQTAEPEVEAPAATELENETPEQRADRQRDEKGRFAKKDSEPQGDDTGTQPAQGVTEEQQAAAPITAPLSVPGELRQAWSQLPREWQEYYAKRDLETSQKLSDQGRQVHELNEVLKEHVADWEVRGITPAQVLKQHLTWSKQFETDPLNAMFRLGSMYGVTPAHVAHALQTNHAQQQQGQQQAQQGQPQIHPELQRELNEIRAFRQQQEQAVIEQKIEFASSHYSAFANEADAQGNLVNPYWQEAYPLMQSMAAGLRERYPEAGAQEFLRICYRAAINADPTLSQKATADSDRSRQQRERQQVEQARKMGSSVRGAPNGAAGSPQRFGSAREAMQAAYEGKI